MNTEESKKVEKVLTNLAKSNLFICDGYMDGEGYKHDYLKDQADNIVMSFKIFPQFDMLTSLKMGVDKLKAKIDSSFK